MAGIEMDHEAKKCVPKVARALGVPDCQIGWGLMDLWEWCWFEKIAQVRAIHLLGFFGKLSGDPIPLLCAFGFLSELEDNPGTFRVHGAEKRLGVSKLRIEAGKVGGKRSGGNKKSIGNLRQFIKPKKSPKQTSNCFGEEAVPPKQDRSTTEANTEARPKQDRTLHPSTLPPFKNLCAEPPREVEENGPGTGELTPPPPEPRKPNPYKEFTDKLYAVFHEHEGCDPEPLEPDWEALRALRKKHPEEEILIRYGRGLRGQYARQAKRFRDLRSKWDLLANEEPQPNAVKTLRTDTTDADFERGMAKYKTNEHGDLLF